MPPAAPTSRTLAACFAGTIALVWVTGLVRFRGWAANDDLAILQLHLERLGDGHVPLVGAYSRLDFHHPGPLREWLFGVAYWASGRRAAALPATALALNLAWVVAACAMGWRAARRSGVVAASLGAVLVMLGLDVNLHSAWNPYLAVLAMYAAVWGAVAVLADGSRNWPVPVVAASFAAQQHVSVLVLGAAVLGLVVVVAIGDLMAGRADRRRVAGVGAALAALWSGPLLDLANGSDSNLVRLLRNGGDGDPVGLLDAARLAGRLLLPWSIVKGDALRAVGAEPPPDAPVVVVLAVVVASALALVGSARRRRVVGRELGVSAAVAGGVTVLVTVTIATGFTAPLYPYLFAPSVGGLALVSAAGALALAPVVRRLTAGRPDPRTHGAVVLAIPAVLVVVTWTVFGWVDLQPIATAPLQRAIERSLPAVVEPGEPYTIAAAGLALSVADAEVALAVQQAGGEPRSSRFALGLPEPVAGSAVLIAAMGEPLACLLAGDPGDRVVVREVSIASALEVGVFLLAPGDAWPAPAECGVALA